VIPEEEELLCRLHTKYMLVTNPIPQGNFSNTLNEPRELL
jgi:hypothetical protein